MAPPLQNRTRIELLTTSGTSPCCRSRNSQDDEWTKSVHLRHDTRNISQSRVPRPCYQRALLMMTGDLCRDRDAKTGWTSGRSKGHRVSLDEQPVKTHNRQAAVGILEMS